MIEILPKELQKKLNDPNLLLLDVRTKEERDVAKIVPSLWIPLDDVVDRFGELDKNKELVVYCHHGMRSEKVAEFLREKGFNAKSLKGGIDRWSEDIDSSVPQY